MILLYYDGVFMSLLFLRRKKDVIKKKRNFDLILGSSRNEEEDFMV